MPARLAPLRAEHAGTYYVSSTLSHPHSILQCDYSGPLTAEELRKGRGLAHGDTEST